MAGSTSCCGVLWDMEGFGAACLEGFSSRQNGEPDKTSSATTAENGYSLAAVICESAASNPDFIKRISSWTSTKQISVRNLRPISN
jgi:hypothetical protein